MSHTPPLLTLKNATLGFGGAPLFADFDWSVHPGERVCLVGRNGSGKSTLLKVMAGTVALDEGTRTMSTQLQISYLAQTPNLSTWSTVEEAAHAALRDTQQNERYLADSYIRELNLNPTQAISQLSGGEARKLALARAFICAPQLLLLDEPTNHLDLPSIEWLEKALSRFEGAVVLISHDRALLERVTRKTLWVERGKVRTINRGFQGFDQWRDEIYHAEDLEKARMDQRLAQELQWLREGISARRTRNQGRLRRLHTLRNERASLRNRQGKVNAQLHEGQRSGRVVIEAKGINYSIAGRTLVSNLDLLIHRGDRVGIIGPNGAGKSTLIKLLTNALTPDSGQLTLGTQLQVLYIDQQRALDPNATLQDVLCVSGSEQVLVHGRPVHVAGYLKDFLFNGGDARRKVKSLSGGERARLLLAQQLSQPANLLILDEPTNDLDIETLELLEELLGDYKGTVLMVSHDRDFLDRVVTTTLCFEGEGVIEEYAGGYTDMLSQRRDVAQHTDVNEVDSSKQQQRVKKKLSYKEKRELENLQTDLERLGNERKTLEIALNDPSLFSRSPTEFQATLDRLEEVKAHLESTEERWLELELLAESLQGEG